MSTDSPHSADTERLVIRRANRSDAGEIARMENAYISCPWTVEQIESEIADESSVFIVAELGGKTVGYLSGKCAADECETSNIAVDSAYRRRGVATALFERFKSELTARGVGRIFLLVATGNSGAIALYTAVGFKSVGLRRGYYVNDDAVIMRLDI